jgi:Putative zinc-finger
MAGRQPTPCYERFVRPAGNQCGAAADYGYVRCEQCREALSARLDGEDDPDERAEVDTHLAECDECRRWVDEAAAVTAWCA